MFLVNSRFPLVSATPPPSRPRGPSRVGVPLLPKLRGHFAEFLDRDSLDRLGILYLITCVGLGYGRLGPRADAFLGSIGSPDPPSRGSRRTSGTQTADFPTVSPTSLDQVNHRLAGLPSCVTPVNALASGPRFPRSPRSAPPPRRGHGTTTRIRRLATALRQGRSFAGTGISTRCPSTTPVGLALGPDSPRAD